MPAAFSRALSASRSSFVRIAGFTHTGWPLRSSTLFSSGAPGPVTTRIFSPVAVGTEKSATALFLSVTEIDPAAMSARPVASMSRTLWLGVGSRVTTMRFAGVVLNLAFSTVSNSRNASTSTPAGCPSMKKYSGLRNGTSTRTRRRCAIASRSPFQGVRTNFMNAGSSVGSGCVASGAEAGCGASGAAGAAGAVCSDWPGLAGAAVGGDASSCRFEHPAANSPHRMRPENTVNHEVRSSMPRFPRAGLHGRHPCVRHGGRRREGPPEAPLDRPSVSRSRILRFRAGNSEFLPPGESGPLLVEPVCRSRFEGGAAGPQCRSLTCPVALS